MISRDKKKFTIIHIVYLCAKIKKYEWEKQEKEIIGAFNGIIINSKSCMCRYIKE